MGLIARILKAIRTVDEDALEQQHVTEDECVTASRDSTASRDMFKTSGSRYELTEKARRRDEDDESS